MDTDNHPAMPQRIRTLRARALTTFNEADPEARRLYWQSQAATEGQPPLIREAKAFAWHCAHRTLTIPDGELIVGASPTLCCANAPARPAIAGRQSFQPWAGIEGPDADLFRQGVVSFAGNHSTMDYAGILAEGLAGTLQRIRQRRQRLTDARPPDAPAKAIFLDALEIYANGYLDLCRRYGELAASLAADAPTNRRAELLAIAEHCRRVPELPPRTFHEACQSLWFSFLLVPDAPGRVDQYLAPFYQRDLRTAEITPEKARELLACLWLKYFEHPTAVAAVGAIHHLTLGGLTPEGRDACNDVTLLALDVTETLALQRPQVGLRCNRHTPQPVLLRAVAALRSHSGSPDFCNDEQIVPALTATGIDLVDARDFSLSGCHEVIIAGKAQMGSVEGFINLPKILRAVLGLEPELDNRADLKSLTDFHRLYQACLAWIDRLAEAVHRLSVLRDRHAAEHPNLPCSLTVRDCIENLKGYTQGGARYNHCNWDLVGLANLADSLAAVRQLVFEEQLCTLTELADALAEDWSGCEPLRLRILNDLPHFGNDDDRVDTLAADILEQFAKRLAKYTPFRGGRYILGTLAGAENMHIEFGRATGATPDGRKSGHPLADSMGAAQGRDQRGVTALLNSVAKLPHRLLPTAATLNVRLDPDLLETPEGITTVAAMIRAHFHSGGQQMQLNLVNRRMLLAAREHPERHAGLMVRVAGYSAPFVSLWPDLQDEILSRTQHHA